MNEDRFDRDLIDALRSSDPSRVAGIYAQAAALMEAAGDVNRACFFYTQAWVFALEAGDALADELRARLVAHGRETEA